MKKDSTKPIINFLAVLTFVISIFILTFQGFAFPDISPIMNLTLRIFAGLCAQLLFLMNFRPLWLRLIPLIVTLMIALWGGWLFLTSDSWQNATFISYFADYCTPALGCAIGWFAYIDRKKEA